MLKAPKGRSSARPEQRIPNPYAAGSNPAAPATPSRPARLRRPSGRSPAAGPRLHAVPQLPAAPLYALLEGRHGEVPRPAAHRRPPSSANSSLNSASTWTVATPKRPMDGSGSACSGVSRHASCHPRDEAFSVSRACDIPGGPLAFTLTGGNDNDCTPFQAVMARIRVARPGRGRPPDPARPCGYGQERRP